MEKKFLNDLPETEAHYTDTLFAEMVLDRALLNYRKEMLHKEIDQSLRDRNKKEFLRLTEELKKCL
ncbi:IDEAL domain-containing protein [Bacillus massilinigeriensis]|uniref:IDEAL domain-containing protein n=1 Tax=Bacillus massilionigeriensis TaxID=1805475 RepID=UPI00096B17E0|nr:IDEAL domain-containing protein [Bacillus massilionigeriensis]